MTNVVNCFMVRTTRYFMSGVFRQNVARVVMCAHQCGVDVTCSLIRVVLMGHAH